MMFKKLILTVSLAMLMAVLVVNVVEEKASAMDNQGCIGGVCQFTGNGTGTGCNLGCSCYYNWNPPDFVGPIDPNEGHCSAY